MIVEVRVIRGMGKWDNIEYVRKYKREYARKHYQERKDIINKRRRECHEENKDRDNETHRNWYYSNIESVRKSTAKQSLKGTQYERRKKWREQNHKHTMGYKESAIIEKKGWSISKPCLMDLHTACSGLKTQMKKCFCPCHNNTKEVNQGDYLI